MAAYNSKPKRIKNGLIQMLSQIQYDAGGGNEAAFVAVLGKARGDFTGYPIVRVLPDQLLTGKAAVSVNDRTAMFVCQVHLLLEDQDTNGTPIDEAAIYDKMYDLTELILDALDEGDFQNALNTIDSTIGEYILNATRGEWLVATDTKGGAVLVCQVYVEIKYSKDL